MNKKGLISILLTALLIFTVVAGVFTQTPVKADAAEGRWVLQSSETVYGNDEYLGTTWTFDHDEIDGQMIYKITSTFTNIDGTFTGLYTTKADIPPGTIRAGERVRLRLSATVQGSMDDGICPNTVYVRMRPYNSDGTKSGATRLYFTKESDGSNDGSSVSVWTGPPSNRQYEDADTIYYDFPEGGYERDRCYQQLMRQLKS